MAMVDGDWTITRSTGAIRYTGDDHGGTAPSYATVIQFHRWIADFADDASSTGDDEHDITDSTASDRSTDNIITLLGTFNIDDNASEHLFDGSIIQAGGDTIYDGIVNFGNVGVRIQLLQDGTKITDDWWNYNVGGSDDTSTDAAFMTDSTASFVTNALIGYVIKNTTDSSEGLITANTGTTVTAVLGGGGENDWDSGDNYLISEGLNSDATSGISARWMIPVRTDGVDVAQRQLIGTNRTFNRTYGEFKINATARGNNVLALSDANDLNNNTLEATVAGWSAISNTEGLRLLDISGDTIDEEYYSEWNRDSFDINQFVERLKWLSRDQSSSTLNGLDGEDFRGLTHSFAYDTEAGTPPTTNDEIAYGTNLVYDTETNGPFTVGEAIHEDTATPVWKGRILALDDNGVDGSIIVDVESGTITTGDNFTGQTSNGQANTNGTPTVVTTGGVFRVMAFDDDGSAGNVYGQLMRGRAPANGDIMYDDTDVANTIVVDGTVTERVVSTPFAGVSTGSAIIGAYGLGMEPSDTAATDTFFDLSNTQVTPPNNVTFTVSGLVSGEDYVLLGTDATSDFDFTQYTLNGALTSGTVTAVVVNGSIDTETPTTGTIRIVRADGLISKHAYTSFSGSTFTIGSTDFSTNNAANAAGVMTSFLDVLATGSSENFTYVFSGNRTLFIRVRDGGTAGDNEGIKTFETTGTMTTAGGSATVIRTSDV